MPFQHAAPWSRWLRGVFAGRSPGVQVVGQDVEDNLRGTVKVADVSNLSEPIAWAQANCRRQQAAGAGEVARVELFSQSAGGLWLQCWHSALFSTIEIINRADALSTGTRTEVNDFGTIPTVSTCGKTNPTELTPGSDVYQWPATLFQSAHWGDFQVYCPAGKVLLFRNISGATTLDISLFWREIP